MTNKDKREAPDNQDLVTRQTYNDLIECRRRLNALEQCLAQQTDHLSQLEGLYQTLVDHTHDFVFSLDETGIFNLVNRRWCESLGYTAEEGIGLHIENIIHPDYLFAWRDIFNQLQAGENVVNQRLIFVTKNGQELVVEGDFISHVKHGHLVAGQGILRDITHLKPVEQALWESEEKYRALIEQSGDAIYLLYGGRFEVINRKFTQLFGVTQEIANSPDFVFTNIVAPKSRKLVKELDKKGVNSPELRPHYEFTALDRHGNEIEIELAVSYITYRGGLATQGILRDITERKQIEAEKQAAYQQIQQYARELAARIEEEQRQREITTILAEVVASVSLTLSGDKLLAHILGKLQQLISYDSASIFLLEDSELVVEASRNIEVKANNRRHNLEDDALFREMQTQGGYILIKDTNSDSLYQPRLSSKGTRCWIGAPLVVAQEVIGYLAVDRHLPNAFTPTDAELVQAFAHQVAQTIYNSRLYADLKNTQAQLIQRERLAALGQMAATVAHELRNPLMAIRMGLSYFVPELNKHDPLYRHATLVQMSTDRIERLVEDILYFARTPQLILAPGSLGSVLEDEIAGWETRLVEKGIDYSLHIVDDLPLTLIDADQLGRALSNLISNSIDILDSDGELVVRLDLKNGHQVITFEDNGPGIAPENQTRVFEPFFTTKSRGTGLGLSIVKQIIEGHQGHISLWNKIEGGTKFTITLPLRSIPESGEEM